MATGCTAFYGGGTNIQADVASTPVLNIERMRYLAAAIALTPGRLKDSFRYCGLAPCQHERCVCSVDLAGCLADWLNKKIGYQKICYEQ